MHQRLEPKSPHIVQTCALCCVLPSTHYSHVDDGFVFKRFTPTSNWTLNCPSATSQTGSCRLTEGREEDVGIPCATLCQCPEPSVSSLYPLFSCLEPPTVLLVSNMKGNSSQSGARLSAVLIDEGQRHTNAQRTITNSQLWHEWALFSSVHSLRGVCAGGQEKDYSVHERQEKWGCCL